MMLASFIKYTVQIEYRNKNAFGLAHKTEEALIYGRILAPTDQSLNQQEGLPPSTLLHCSIRIILFDQTVWKWLIFLYHFGSIKMAIFKLFNSRDLEGI